MLRGEDICIVEMSQQIVFELNSLLGSECVLVVGDKVEG